MLSRRALLIGTGSAFLTACGFVGGPTPTPRIDRPIAAAAAAAATAAALPAGGGTSSASSVAPLSGTGLPPSATPLPPTPTATLVPPRPTVTPTPRPPPPTPTPMRVPRALEIPRIGVDAPIKGVGTRPSGELDAPDGPSDVGWFAGGPRPGEPGNALLTGHLDWRTGQTAVFWRLKELVPGDPIFVRTETDRLPFVVESTAVYERDKAPADRILGFAIGRVITIITCEGQFIASERDYTQRRVVRARLV